MKILVVEDEPLIRLGLAGAIEDAGYDVLEAPNADAAIDIIESHPGIVMVVTDVDMPGSMDGIKLAHYVNLRWPPIRLIVISGKVGVPAALPQGARFLTKPYQEPQLLKTISTLIEGGAA